MTAETEGSAIISLAKRLAPYFIEIGTCDEDWLDGRVVRRASCDDAAVVRVMEHVLENVVPEWVAEKQRLLEMGIGLDRARSGTVALKLFRCRILIGKML